MVCAYRSSPEHPTSPRKQELQLLLHHPKAEHLLAGAGKALGRAAQCIAVSNHRHTAVAMQGVSCLHPAPLQSSGCTTPPSTPVSPVGWQNLSPALHRGGGKRKKKRSHDNLHGDWVLPCLLHSSSTTASLSGGKEETLGIMDTALILF